jgi:hypothetical protein
MNRETDLDALERQIQRLGRRIESLRTASRRYSWFRLAIIIAGVAVGFLTFRLAGDIAGIICVVLFAAGFMAAASLHGKIERGIARHIAWRDIKMAHAARMRLDWGKIPRPYAVPAEPEHPFEADLDLLGPGSLHHLADTGVTFEGSERLREWLRARPAAPAVIALRQAQVRELAPLTLFRDKLALHTRLASSRTGERWNASELMKGFGGEHRPGPLGTALAIATALAAVTITLAILGGVGVIPSYWGYTWAAYVLLLLSQHGVTKENLEHALSMEIALAKFAAGFRHIETFNYSRAPHLRSLCAPFLDTDNGPSRQIAGISRLVAATSFQSNPLLWGLVNAVVPLNLYLAFKLASSRVRIERYLPVWLDTWFELEALGSLANFAHLNPGYVFPTIDADGDEAAPVFEARAMGHPLIAHETRTHNDFRFGDLGDIALITGSNMAGKSTFLRTLGINLVLAYAGAPVDAASLRARRLDVFTSIRINDSLSEGFSFFYAEVRRLRRILTALETAGADETATPVLYLIDEIFRGTNNRERLVGSTAYIRALAGERGVGAIATHDLELVRLADEIPSITNYHFREQVVGGTMTFDYLLHPGPCPTTNALVIMRMAGLPVDEGTGGLEGMRDAEIDD